MLHSRRDKRDVTSLSPDALAADGEVDLATYHVPQVVHGRMHVRRRTGPARLDVHLDHSQASGRRGAGDLDDGRGRTDREGLAGRGGGESGQHLQLLSLT